MLHGPCTRATIRVIIPGMADPTTVDQGKKKVPPPARGAETSPHPDSGLVVLAIGGDPIVGHALVLLLRNSRYDVKFLAAPSLREPGALEGIRLLLLTPALNSRYQEALSEALENEPDGTAKIPTLKLVASSGGGQVGGAQEELEHAVPWPCNTEELKQQIEAILFGGSRVDQAPGGNLPTTTS